MLILKIVAAKVKELGTKIVFLFESIVFYILYD